MTVTITAQDGTSDTTTPYDIAGWATESQSGNIVHELLAPGTIAMTVVGDMPRNGTLHLIYQSDAAAAAARALLSRRTTFRLADTSRPTVGMFFGRAGAMTTAIHDALNDVWVFEVGFQEVPE